MVLGLGKREKLEWLEVKWPMPGGTTQRFTGLPVNRYITIVEGEEKWKLGRRWIGGRGIICTAAQMLPAQDDMPNSQPARRTFIPCS